MDNVTMNLHIIQILIELRNHYMTLQQYFTNVVSQIQNNHYSVKIRDKSKKLNISNDNINAITQALHYLMYEYFCDKRKSKNTDIQKQFIDLKRNQLFDYILIPDDCDYDFTKVDLYQFLQFIRLIKE